MQRKLNQTTGTYNLSCAMCPASCVMSHWFKCHVSRPCVLCLVSCVACHVSCVMCHVSCVMCHVSCILCLVSCVLCHVSCVMCHVSCVLCHVSHVMYHVSFCMCHVSCVHAGSCVVSPASQTRKKIYLLTNQMCLCV
jgi:hypothetical protein